MENTKFLRNYINLIKYDKPHNSLPIILISVNALFMQINCFAAILNETDMEECLVAASKFLLHLLMQGNMLTHSLKPGGIMELIQLIENYTLVGQHHFMNRKAKWTKFEVLYEKKLRSFKAIRRTFTITLVIICICVIMERPIKEISSKKQFRIESRAWPTPYLSYIPDGLETWTFFCYLFSIQCLSVIMDFMNGYLILSSIWMSTEKLLVDFETIFILLEDLAGDFPVENENFIESENCRTISKSATAALKDDMRLIVEEDLAEDFPVENENLIESEKYRIISKSATERRNPEALKEDMRLIVECHQRISRNFQICADNASASIVLLIIAIGIDLCYNAYSTLQAKVLKDAANFVFAFLTVCLTTLFIFNNGQRLFNQNDILRGYLRELPWIDKPRWFRQTVHIMMTRANVDFQLNPYGIFVLNLMSYKEMLKFIVSSANVLYTVERSSRL